MALSDWDTMALTKGGPSIGALRHPDTHVAVEVYKNWLYVKDPDAWREGRDFSGDTVMQITEGHVQYGGWTIDAVRGPQNGVYVVAVIGSVWKPQDALVACGTSGYQVTDVSETIRHDEEFVPPRYTGVLPTSVTFLRRHMESVLEDRSPIAEDLWAKAVRFCQGDGFFAANLDQDLLQPTRPGQANDTVASQLIRQIGERG